MKTKLLFILFSLVILNGTASHLIGGDIIYRCVGANDYEITLTVYRDCSGIGLGSPTEDVLINSSCGSFTAVLNEVDLSPGDPGTAGVKDTSYLCNDIINSTTCDPGGTYPGIEIYQWKGIVTLTPCSDWEFEWDQNARNPAFNYPAMNDCGQSYPNAFLRSFLPASQNLRLRATMNNVDGLCNGSPNFRATPKVFICQGQEVLIDQGGIDPDGDSLTYQLVAPLVSSAGSALDTLGYEPGFSSQQPISTEPGTSFGIDLHTGEMRITAMHFGLQCNNPDSLEQSSMAVLVSQYRNGNLVGTTIRDIQIVTLPDCGNFEAVNQGITNLGNNTFLQNDTLKVHAGNTFDFTMQIIDVINSDSFPLYNNLVGQIPNVNFNFFSFGNPNIMRGRTVAPTDASLIGVYNFDITATNNGCPNTKTYVFPYVLEILPPDSTNLSLHNHLKNIFNVYPNPTNGKLNIQLNEAVNNAKISVLDITGKEFYTKTITTNKASIHLNAPSGVYFVRIATANKTEVKKIIVE